MANQIKNFSNSNSNRSFFNFNLFTSFLMFIIIQYYVYTGNDNLWIFPNQGIKIAPHNRGAKAGNALFGTLSGNALTHGKAVKVSANNHLPLSSLVVCDSCFFLCFLLCVSFSPSVDWFFAGVFFVFARIYYFALFASAFWTLHREYSLAICSLKTVLLPLRFLLGQSRHLVVRRYLSYSSWLFAIARFTSAVSHDFVAMSSPFECGKLCGKVECG